MPACWNAHITNPEQSNPPGAAPPHTYGDPIWVNAACTTTARSPPSPPPGDVKGTPDTPPGIGAWPGAGAPSGAGGAPGGSASGAGPPGTPSGTRSGIGPGLASALRWSGLNAWYCDLTTAIWTCS